MDEGAVLEFVAVVLVDMEVRGMLWIDSCRRMQTCIFRWKFLPAEACDIEDWKEGRRGEN